MTPLTTEQVEKTTDERRVLDPLERASEVLFGLIMVLTFTGSISVAESGREEIRTILVGALGCNLAWGFVDGVMYLMASFTNRGRELLAQKAIRGAPDVGTAHRLIQESLPSFIARVLAPAELESLRGRLILHSDRANEWRLTLEDLRGAFAVFLLVFLSTFPVVVPFIFMHDAYPAVRASNAIAVAMLFFVGSSLGRYAGRPGWRTGLAMVLIGLVLVAITMALGG